MPQTTDQVEDELDIKKTTKLYKMNQLKLGFPTWEDYNYLYNKQQVLEISEWNKTRRPFKIRSLENCKKTIRYFRITF